MNTVWSILLGIAGVYGVLAGVLFFTQSRLLYYPNLPSRDLIATPGSVGLSYEPVELSTEDGLTLYGWFIPAHPARGVLLFFHGNAGNISHRLDSLKTFNDLGFATLIFDYRGFGRSQGKPSESGTYRDAEAAWRFVTEKRRVPAQDIVIFGRSLGASIAAHLAAQHKPRGLILESAFTSVPDLAASLYPFLPARWMSRFHYNTREYLKSISCPVLIVHSRHDEIIPFEHGRQLFALANEPKQFLELRGGHNDGFMVSAPTYLKGLDTFLSAHLGK